MPAGPAHIAQQQARDNAEEASRKQEQRRKIQLKQTHGTRQSTHTDDGGGALVVGDGDGLYDDVEINASGGASLKSASPPAAAHDQYQEDDGDDLYVAPGTSMAPKNQYNPGGEPLYVDMFDANVPTATEIAEEQVRHNNALTGRDAKISNEEFGRLQAEARERHETAARANRNLLDARDKTRQQGAAWRAARQPTFVPKDENFFEFEQASNREFANDDDIYEAVPDWFCTGQPRDKVETAVMQGSHGDFLVRESSDGSKYIICLNVVSTIEGQPITRSRQASGASGVFHAIVLCLFSYPSLGRFTEPRVLLWLF